MEIITKAQIRILYGQGQRPCDLCENQHNNSFEGPCDICIGSGKKVSGFKQRLPTDTECLDWLLDKLATSSIYVFNKGTVLISSREELYRLMEVK